MHKETIDLNRLLELGSQSILERTLVAEFLFSKGYLNPDLKELPWLEEEKLTREACRFAKFRLAEIESGDIFPWKIGLAISLN